MQMMSKESLKKLNIQELEGQLSVQRENLQNLSSVLSQERQKQILKNKAIRGSSKKRKEELIRQILQLQKEAARVQAKINGIKTRNEMLTHLAANYRGTRKNLTIDDDGYRYREIIAKYEDYIKAGRIKRQNSLSKYEAADWFADNYMSEEDMRRAIEAADKRKEKAAEAWAKKLEKNRETYATMIDF